MTMMMIFFFHWKQNSNKQQQQRMQHMQIIWILYVKRKKNFPFPVLFFLYRFHWIIKNQKKKFIPNVFLFFLSAKQKFIHSLINNNLNWSFCGFFLLLFLLYMDFLNFFFISSNPWWYRHSIDLNIHSHTNIIDIGTCVTDFLFPITHTHISIEMKYFFFARNNNNRRKKYINNDQTGYIWFNFYYDVIFKNKTRKRKRNFLQNNPISYTHTINLNCCFVEQMFQVQNTHI